MHKMKIWWKYHKSEGWVLFEVFEKLMSACFIQISRETILLPYILIIYMKMFETIVVLTYHMFIANRPLAKFSWLCYITLYNANQARIFWGVRGGGGGGAHPPEMICTPQRHLAPRVLARGPCWPCYRGQKWKNTAR
jgi:hypothetical protein